DPALAADPHPDPHLDHGPGSGEPRRGPAHPVRRDRAPVRRPVDAHSRSCGPHGLRQLPAGTPHSGHAPGADGRCADRAAAARPLAPDEVMAFDYFVVLAEMRTGSNLLESNLNAFDGIHCHGELFNPGFINAPGTDSYKGVTFAQREADPWRLMMAV